MRARRCRELDVTDVGRRRYVAPVEFTALNLDNLVPMSVAAVPPPNRQKSSCHKSTSATSGGCSGLVK
jgi:hypothetical protein